MKFNRRLLIALILGMTGITIEVFFTALSEVFFSFISRNPISMKLKGHSYIYMFFIYSMALPILDLIYPSLKKIYLFIRLLIYSLIIIIIEFFIGLFLELIIGVCPWKYSSGLHVYGYTRIDYMLLWMFFGFLIERLYILLNCVILNKRCH